MRFHAALRKSRLRPGLAGIMFVLAGEGRRAHAGFFGLGLKLAMRVGESLLHPLLGHRSFPLVVI